MDQPLLQPRTAGIRKEVLISTGLTALAVTLVSLLLQSIGRIPFSSDQAIIALMGRDILEKGVHPIFCYGSLYGGTGEAHLLAASFGLFGSSIASFRVVTVTLAVLSAIAGYGLGRQLFGARGAAITAAGFVLAPHFYYYKILTSDGDYATILLCAVVFAWLAVAIDQRLAANLRSRLWVLALGVVAGGAWWSNPTAILLPLALGLAITTSRRAHWLRPSILGWATAGAVAGAAPWLLFNLRWRWPSLTAAENRILPFTELPERFADLVATSLPTLLGARPVWKGQVSLLLSCVAVALFALALAWGAVRLWREREPTQRFAFALLFALALAPLLVATCMERTDREPRFLLISYAGLIPLLASLFLRSSKPLRIALAAVCLLLGPMSWWTAPKYRGLEGGPEPEDIGVVISRLEELGVDRVYASYWTAYRISFLSQGRVLASPFGSWTHGARRHKEIAATVDAVPRPSFLLRGVDRRAMDNLIAGGRLDVAVLDIPPYRLYRSLPEDLARGMRQCRCIPATVGEGDLEWLEARGPRSLVTGATVLYHLRFRRNGQIVLSNNVHASYHWKRSDGTIAVHDGLRTELWDTEALEGALGLNRNQAQALELPIAVPVLANVEPGRYTLEFDLVDEGWAWFESLGIPPLSLMVEVSP